MKHRAAAVQMVSTGNIHQNLESAAKLIAAAAEKGAELVLLPENFAVLDGGPLRRFAERQGDPDGLLQGFLAAQARSHGITLVGGTIPLISRPDGSDGQPLPDLDDGRVRPACLVYDQGGVVVARYDKMHLFDVRVADRQAEYSESRSFEAGNDPVIADTSVGRVGLTICYDLRFPELYRKLAEAGAEIFTVPSAFTRITGKAHWEVLLRARAIENQCFVIAANQGGVHNESRETFGHSMIIDPWGTVLDSVGVGEGVVSADLDLKRLTQVRQDMPIASHRRL